MYGDVTDWIWQVIFVQYFSISFNHRPQKNNTRITTTINGTFALITKMLNGSHCDIAFFYLAILVIDKRLSFSTSKWTTQIHSSDQNSPFCSNAVNILFNAVIHCISQVIKADL